MKKRNLLFLIPFVSVMLNSCGNSSASVDSTPLSTKTKDIYVNANNNTQNALKEAYNNKEFIALSMNSKTNGTLETFTQTYNNVIQDNPEIESSDTSVPTINIEEKNQKFQLESDYKVKSNFDFTKQQGELSFDGISIKVNAKTEIKELGEVEKPFHYLAEESASLKDSSILTVTDGTNTHEININDLLSNYLQETKEFHLYDALLPMIPAKNKESQVFSSILKQYKEYANDNIDAKTFSEEFNKIFSENKDLKGFNTLSPFIESFAKELPDAIAEAVEIFKNNPLSNYYEYSTNGDKIVIELNYSSWIKKIRNELMDLNSNNNKVQTSTNLFLVANLTSLLPTNVTMISEITITSEMITKVSTTCDIMGVISIPNLTSYHLSLNNEFTINYFKNALDL